MVSAGRWRWPALRLQPRKAEGERLERLRRRQGRGGGGGGGNNPNPNAPTQPPLPEQLKEDAVNFQLVGFNDLQARSAYQPTIMQQGNRWIAYVGTHGGQAVNPLTGQMEQNGTLIIDVTDPKNPRTLIHLPGQPGATPQAGGEGAQMVRICSGATLPRADRTKFYMLRTYGGSAHETWDVTDPAKPVRLAVVVSGLRDTHKNFWECDTGIAFLVSGVPDWRTMRMTQIYDLSNPAQPVFIRNFGLNGQQPGTTGPVPTELHGAISLGPSINRVYMGYGTGSDGVIQILDREKLLNGPKEPTEANLKYPVIAQVDMPPDMGSHTAFPDTGLEHHGIRQAEAARGSGLGRRGSGARFRWTAAGTEPGAAGLHRFGRRNDRQRMPGEPPDAAHDRHHQRAISRRRFGVYGSGSQREFLRHGRPFRLALD